MGVFEVLANDQTERNLMRNRAAIAMAQRVQKYASFLQSASGANFNARIALIAPEIKELAVEVNSEYPGATPLELDRIAYRALAGGHKPGCTCGFCENKGNLPGSDSEDEDEVEKEARVSFEAPSGSIDGAQADPSGPGGPIGEELSEQKSGETDDELGGPIGENASGKKGASVLPRVFASFDWDGVAKTASFCDCDCEGCSDGGGHCESEKCISSKRTEANPLHDDKSSKVSVETGDTYTQETVSLPKADNSGVGSEGSPKIDKGKVPEGGLKAIDVPSKQHPVETQDLGSDTPDYWKDLPGVSETGKSIDADKPLQPEHNTAPNTDTWSGTEGLASPVTSKWYVLASAEDA